MSRFDKIGFKRIKLGSLEADLYAIAANFSTLMNFLLGFLIIFSILIQEPLDRILAMRMIMLGASFDAVDGRLARRSNTKPKLGPQFDTAADLMTFGFAPSMMIIHMFFESNNYIAFLLASMYLFAASFRLSRFMLEPTYGYFNGMPSPVAATYIAAWYVQNSESIDRAEPILVVGGIALIATVMIVSLPYTALKNVRTYYQKFYFVFTISMMLLLTYSPSSWFEILTLIWLIYVTYFSIIGPVHARRTLSELIGSKPSTTS